MIRFTTVLISVTAVSLFAATPSEAYQRGNRAQYHDCNSWCLDHNRYPSSQRQCQAQCCKYYGPSGNDDGVYTCSVVRSPQTAAQQESGGGKPKVSLPPSSILPKLSN